MNKEDVLKLEEELSFDHFDAEDAYCIGNEIVKKTSKPVRIRWRYCVPVSDAWKKGCGMVR